MAARPASPLSAPWYTRAPNKNCWSLLLHTVPSIIRRVAPNANTHSLAQPTLRTERDITATAAGHAA
jgi:hypothetical protein